jgi:tetratricopeptide (TPR) repeat protein
MMFENFDPVTHSPSSENTRFFPVSSLEEVAVHLRDNDEEGRYEHYLVQIKHPIAKTDSAGTPKSVLPPPFSVARLKSAVSSSTEAPASGPALMEKTVKPRDEAPSPSFKAEKDDIPYLSENAELLLSAGETNLARNIYRAILKSGESSEIAYAGLAACSDREGLIDQAIQFARDSIAFAPNQRGYRILSQLLIQQGQDQEASQVLSRALRSLELSTREKAEYQKTIGNCLSRLGQNQEAERAYKKALELSPASDEVQSNLGSLYLEQGQIQEAKRCYQDSIASNPANDKAWVGLGLCHVSEGDKEAAHEAFVRSLEKNLRNSTAIFHLVKCAYEIKKYSTAEKMLSDYIEVAPVSPSLLYSLAGLQFHVGKKREASITARRILQIKGDHQGARDLMSRIESES